MVVNYENKIFCKQLILGSGPGGSVAFNQLAKAGFSPIIIEEGINISDDLFQDNLSKLTFQNYRYGGISPILGSPIFSHGEAKILGGGSTINGGLMWHTPKNIQDEWKSKLSKAGIDGNDIYKFFNEIDHYMAVERQTLIKGYDLDSDKVVSGCKKLGWNVVQARRAVQSCARSNQCSAGCPSGAKRSMVKSCLKEGENNGGEILTKLRAEKIIVRSGRVTEVLCKNLSLQGSKTVTIIPSDVFLATGALETPKLLLRSKIVAANQLRLGLHLNLRFLAKFPNNIDASQGTMFTFQVQEFLNEGILIMASNLRKMYLAPILSKLDRTNSQKLLNDFRSLGLYTTTVRPISYGGFLKIPFLDAFPYFYINNQDLEQIKLAAQKTCELLFTAGAEFVVLPFSKPKCSFSYDDASKLINEANKKDFDFLTVHAMSSLPITNTKLISKAGQINGINNLQVCDASILPSTMGESPQETIMAFSHYIIKRWIDKNL